MWRKIGRLILSIMGGVIGYEIAKYGAPYFFGLIHVEFTELISLITRVSSTLIFAIIFYFLSYPFFRWLKHYINWIEVDLGKVPTQDIVAGAVGGIVGLVIANLLTLPFSRLPLVGRFLPVISSLLLGYLGMNIAIQKREELLNFFGSFPLFGGRRNTNEVRSSKSDSGAKILDTSVIIDGRIADICKSGFVEGTLVIPNFVLDELRHIADSSDLLRRNRGRRGLDILNIIQSELDIPVQIWEQDFEDIAEVDSKLIRLAKVMDGKIFTNDYNLNKVAILQGVTVLNINELANAVKPVVLPGEEMIVTIVKEGKEHGQGVAYLDDGTMIVVDGGKRSLGETLAVIVTSVLQTAAGRMIFAKQK